MKSSNISLHINAPCHENWENMLPDQSGKFCLSCQKTVVDFTSMTDQQVLHYFKKYQGNNTCGRFLPEQLDRKLYDTKASSPGYWRYFWQIITPAVMALHHADAQTRPILQPNLEYLKDAASKKNVMKGKLMGKIAVFKQDSSKYQYSFQILDSTGKPIPNATINIDEKTKVADSIGKVDVDWKNDALMTISSTGYNSRQTTTEALMVENMSAATYSWESKKQILTIPITLQASTDTLSEVVVVGYGTIRCRSFVAGGVSIVRENQFYQENRHSLRQTVETSLKVFPNPLTIGQDFTISLQNAKPAKHVMKIFDMQGKLVSRREAITDKTTYIWNVEGNVFTIAGIYIVEIVNTKDKKGKTLTGKIVVQ